MAASLGYSVDIIRDLSSHIRRGDAEPFEFGRLDCCLWVADWVKLQTGFDPAADWRGQYSTRDEYRHLLLTRGNLIRVATRAMQQIGATPILPADAKPGDVGVIMTEDGPALAIRDRAAWAAKTGDRLARTPDALRAWRL